MWNKSELISQEFLFTIWTREKDPAINFEFTQRDEGRRSASGRMMFWFS